ncbi:Ornithine carbamoyltransferase 1, catabolic [Frankliniella fusca]|uniref:Ornithine carbamoyltransferase 1, catabolic n=1 Tax=Frankliniella fusca TaxID=407009 RepID=A0AAE1HR55_9NEOP|nr:Ornithine carbamoyltransferase 1, catabolic [Frankliniella fusca]
MFCHELEVVGSSGEDDEHWKERVEVFSSLHMLKQMYSILESFNFFSTHVFFESVRYVPLSIICDNASAQVFKKAEEFFVTLSMA